MAVLVVNLKNASYWRVSLVLLTFAIIARAAGGTRADADALFQSGRYKEAADSYLALLRASPSDPALLDAMGQTLRQMHLSRSAVPFFQREFALNPANRGAGRSLAVALAESDAPDEARRVLDQLTSSDPADAQSWYLMGVLSYQSGYYTAAIDQFDRCLKPGGAPPFKNRAEVLRAVALVEAGRPAEAAVVIPKLLAQPENAKNLDLYLGYASVLYESGRYTEALKQTDLALAVNPDNASAHFWRARIFQQQDQIAAAIGEAERARQLGPDSPAPRSLLVRLYLKSGRTEDAERETAWLREREAKAATP